ncbi:MAG: RNA polymerase sigma-70 factor [Chitinophagaceae bacterium]|nr:MAG: RNA polymerase sigma-70 factor [Chitinophagaceae bacterium]
MDALHNQALFNLFVNGDEAAFKVVYQSYRYRVYEYAKKWLNDSSEVEDVTAETFIKLWNKRSHFENYENIVGFLFVTVKNACFDILRHKKMKSEKETEIQNQFNQYHDFGLMEIKEDFLKLIYAEVEKLPLKMKEVFLLSFEEGLKPNEIAQLLNISVQTVSNQKSSAIKILKQVLSDKPALFLMFLIHFRM